MDAIKRKMAGRIHTLVRTSYKDIKEQEYQERIDEFFNNLDQDAVDRKKQPAFQRQMVLSRGRPQDLNFKLRYGDDAQDIELASDDDDQASGGPE